MKMIMIDRLIQIIRSSSVKFVCVHHSRNNILRTELLFNESVRFFIEPLCKFIATVSLEVHRVNINNDFIEQRCILPKTSHRYLAVCFHFSERIHIGQTARFLVMNIEWDTAYLNIDIVVAFVLSFVVPFSRANVRGLVLLNSGTAHIGFCHRFLLSVK